jgi:2-keto-3-deoxy-L-rhamnonate aldolase RhmA
MFDPDYFKTANDELLIAVQIETQAALDNLDEILAVPGIDACYIGPWDLSVSLGFGVPPDWEAPRYKAAFDRVLEISAKHGKPAGMFCIPDTVEWAVEKGFVFNTIEADDHMLMRSARADVEQARKAAEKRQKK